MPQTRNGYVADMGSCGEFTEDGRDNGVTPANVIEDQHLSCLGAGLGCGGLRKLPGPFLGSLAGHAVLFGV